MLAIAVRVLTCVSIGGIGPTFQRYTVKNESTLQATTPSNRELVLTRTFAAPRQAVFDALTQTNHLVHWMKPTNFLLVWCDVDLRAGGSFRYVYARPSGARVEVRGAYKTVDSPNRVEYTQTYDFSPAPAARDDDTRSSRCRHSLHTDDRVRLET